MVGKINRFILITKMNRIHNELWAECLRFVNDNIGDELFATWFGDIVSLRFENNELHIRVPSPFFAEYIDKKFIGVLGAGIKKVYGEGVDLFYHYNIAAREDNSAVEVKSAPESKVVMPGDDRQMSNPFIAKKLQPIDPQLNPLYTFNNYCKSESNKIAVTISESIAAHHKKNQFNPLFLFGPTGVGKTHLVQAIGIAIKEKDPENRVLYVTARLFMSQYTTAVAQGRTNMFFAFYQSIDTLIVDDVQDFNGKQSTQNTFYHIFNHLYLNNKRIILSCDRSPAEMEGFEERLLGRFKCGISINLEKPDLNLRKKVLETKALKDGVKLENDVVDYIAVNVTESIRELEGVMVSLVAHATILNKPISMELAKIVVENAIKITRHTINFEIIANEVSAFYGIEPDALFTKSRKREISDARQMVMYLAKKHTDMPLTVIGRRLGRSHSTVIYAVNTLEERVEFDKNLKEEIKQIEASLKP